MTLEPTMRILKLHCNGGNMVAVAASARMGRPAAVDLHQQQRQQ